jgi:hypothetical protein
VSHFANDEPRDAGAVLVFGTNRGERHAAQRAIAAHGYPVLLASSMAEAAKCIASGRVRAIVLTDSAGAAPVEGGPISSAPDSIHHKRRIPEIRHHPPPGANDESAVLTLVAAVKAALA